MKAVVPEECFLKVLLAFQYFPKKKRDISLVFARLCTYTTLGAKVWLQSCCMFYHQLWLNLANQVQG